MNDFMFIVQIVIFLLFLAVLYFLWGQYQIEKENLVWILPCLFFVLHSLVFYGFVILEYVNVLNYRDTDPDFYSRWSTLRNLHLVLIMLFMEWSRKRILKIKKGLKQYES